MKPTLLCLAICWWHSATFAAGDALLTVNNYQQQPYNSAVTPQNAQPATIAANVGPLRVRANIKHTPNNVRYETRYTQSRLVAPATTAPRKPTVLIAPGAEGLLPPHHTTAHFASRSASTVRLPQQQQPRQRPQNYQQLAARPRYVLLDSYQNPIVPASRRVINVYPTTFQGRTHFVQRTPAQPVHQQYYVAQRLTAARPHVARPLQPLNRSRTVVAALTQRLRGRYQNCDHPHADEAYGDQHDDVYEEVHVDPAPSESSDGSATVSDSSFTVSNASVTVVSSTASTSTSTPPTTTTTATSTTQAPVVKQYEIRRRPAIQQHFYDVEQKVIVRPVGSAVLELDHGDHHHHYYPHAHHHNDHPAPPPPPPTTPAATTSAPEPTPHVPSTTVEPNYTPAIDFASTNASEPQPADDGSQSDTEIVQPIPAGFPTHEESPSSAPAVAYEQTAVASPDYDYEPQPADYHHTGIDAYGPTAGGPQFIPYPPVYGPIAHPVAGGYYPGEIDDGSYPDVQLPSPGYIPAPISPQPQPSLVHHHHHQQPAGFAGGVDESDYYGQQPTPVAVSTTPLPCPPADSELIDPQAAGTHPTQDPDTYDDGQRHQQTTNTDADYAGSSDDYDNARRPADDVSEVDALAQNSAAPIPFRATIRAPTPAQHQRSQPLVEIRSRGSAPAHLQRSQLAAPPPLAVVHNRTESGGYNRTNEQRLLDFYAVRGGVTEVDDHPAFTNGPTNGHQIVRPAAVVAPAAATPAAAARTPLRARVISVTPAPDFEPGSEQSNVRRVVVSKSIETEERVEIGATKAEQQRQQLQQRRQQRQQQQLARSKVVEPRKY